MRKIFLILKTVLIEAIRRKEIYAIVLFSCALIAAIGSVRFFDIPGLGKFYRDIALKVMSLASSLTVIVLAARQLPREFERRTIYTLMAKPLRRSFFLLGKFLGVMCAGAFCFVLFMIIFVLGSLYLRTEIYWGLFLQYFYLPLWSLAIVASLAFMLSLLGNLDMAITVSVLILLLAQMFTSTISMIYNHVGSVAQFGLRALNYTVPQLTLFDLREKFIHGELWAPISAGTLGVLTLYGAVYTFVFLTISLLLFRRRPL